MSSFMAGACKIRPSFGRLKTLGDLPGDRRAIFELKKAKTLLEYKVGVLGVPH